MIVNDLPFLQPDMYTWAILEQECYTVIAAPDVEVSSPDNPDQYSSWQRPVDWTLYRSDVVVLNWHMMCFSSRLPLACPGLKGNTVLRLFRTTKILI